MVMLRPDASGSISGNAEDFRRQWNWPPIGDPTRQPIPLPSPSPSPTPVPEPSPTDGGGVGTMDNSSEELDPFSYVMPQFRGAGRPKFNFGPVPEFKYDKFVAPTAEEALNSPGYQFRLSEGEKALQQSAAGQGVLRTGGTLKDIIGYGQKFASQEYQNVYDRALSAYDRIYQGAKDAFAPRLLEYQMKSQAEQLAGLAAFNREWQQYVFGIDDEFRREQLAAGLVSQL